MSGKRSLPDGDAESDATIKKKGHWSLGLLSSLDDPKYFVQADDLVTVITDKYPKAKFHYLIIPKENISSLKVVTSKHLTLLKHMHHVGKELTRRETCRDRHFKLGYHAEASMVSLHLHVISDDMNSECLKTKKHWNSFNTDFFMSSKSICKQLKDTGKLLLPPSSKCKEYLSTTLKCNKCDFYPKHIPDLKRHMLAH